MKNFTWLLGMLFLVGCQDINRSPEPEGLIPPDKMVDILTEISLLHGARSYNKDLMEEKGIDPTRYIYQKYNIDSLQFLQSNNFYAENYKTYHEIIVAVKTRLESLKVEYDSIREREQRIKDSLRELARKDTLAVEAREKQADSLLPINKKLPHPISHRDSLR